MATQSIHSLNPKYYEEVWQSYSDEDYDLVIIGGGSVGAGASLDAATRGLKTTVIEARDFAAGTSSRSSKMFHGGLRYLAMLDFRLVAESLHERELNMSTLAPHLVKPLKFIFPLTHRLWERVMMFGGFSLYDLMGGAKSVPMQKHLTRRGVLKIAPGLKDDAVVGGVRYFDTLVDDARHTMTVLRTAAEFGATVRTGTEVVGFDKDASGRIVAARVRDRDTGREAIVRGKSFINATGVWNDKIQELAGVTGKFTVHASKGVHIVVPKDALDAAAALCFVTEKSVLFVIPWGEYWIIGTTDTDWKKGYSLPDPAPTKADIDYILNQINQRVTHQITREDIVGVYAGLRPLLAGNSDSTTNLSRNHAVAKVAAGMVSVAGGKYTTYRVIGKDAVDLAVKELINPVPESITERTLILGAEGYHALANQIPALASRYSLGEDVIEHLLGRYGSLLDEVLRPATDDASLLEPVPGADSYLWAEVRYAVTHEGALHLDDILHRRLRVAIEFADRGIVAAEPVAQFVAPLLGWDDSTRVAELERFTTYTEAELAAEAALTDKEANDILVRAAGNARPSVQ